jgi:hypothetical protein
MGPSTPVSIFADLKNDGLNQEERSAIQKHSFLLAHFAIASGFLLCALLTVWLIQFTSAQPNNELLAQEEIHRTVLGYELNRTPLGSLRANDSHSVCVFTPHMLEGSGSELHAINTQENIHSYGTCKARIVKDGHKQHFLKLGLVSWLYGHRASVLLDRGQKIHYLLQRSQGQWHVIERRIQLKRTS